jgi:hypothetical protein
VRNLRRSEVFEEGEWGFVVVILGVVKSFTLPICEFILRSDKTGFRDIVTPNEWQKRQWMVVSGVKGTRAAADQKRPSPMLLLGIKAVRERDMIAGESSD